MERSLVIKHNAYGQWNDEYPSKVLKVPNEFNHRGLILN